jgi:D-glutamate N-acetyltransferase
MARDLRYLVLAEGQFGPMTSKTANGCIRYSPERVVAVLDSRHAGQTANDVIGYGGDIPIVASVADGLRFAPNALLIGIAPTGGKFPEAWRPIMRAAIERGLEIWSGLHTFIGDDPEFASLAATHGVTIHDLRKPPENLPVAAGRVRDVASTIVLTVGTDCNIGKMTASLQLRDGLRKRNRSVAFAGTGQTGILIEGWGISVDAVIADFIAGASERLTLDAAKEAEIVLVEGQGSLVHPGYSGVTYGLMQGSLPHAMIMCAQPSRTAINNNPWVKIPPLPEFIALHERVLAPLRPSKTIAVALNTYDLPEQDARDAIARTEDDTGLPSTDPVRFDPAPIVDAIERFHANRPR